MPVRTLVRRSSGSAVRRMPEFVAIGQVHAQVHSLGSELIHWRDAAAM